MTNSSLEAFITKCIENFENISLVRQEKIAVLTDFIASKINEPSIALVFVCTHNSRRSFFAQVWAQIAADYYGFNQIEAYSGGTTQTAIFKETIAALKRSGLMVETLSNEGNPIHSIRYHKHKAPIIGFSKAYNHPFNPTEGFAAIMTCGDADANCPFIPEASQRISLTYVDPKAFDSLPTQTQEYDKKSLEIATELFYTFSQIKNNLK